MWPVGCSLFVATTSFYKLHFFNWSFYLENNTQKHSFNLHFLCVQCVLHHQKNTARTCLKKQKGYFYKSGFLKQTVSPSSQAWLEFAAAPPTASDPDSECHPNLMTNDDAWAINDMLCLFVVTIKPVWMTCFQEKGDIMS